MFKNNYYYIVAGLADITIDQLKMPLKTSEFIQILNQHLDPEELKLVRCLFLKYDNQNILNILENNDKPFLEGGNYSKVQIEAEIKEPGFSEEYLNRFILAFKEDKALNESLLWEDQLSELFYESISNINNEFLRSYFEFDLNINNAIVALNIRKHNLKDKKRIIGNNSIAIALKSSGLKDYGISGEFPLIEQIISASENQHVLSREKQIDRIIWEYLDELNTFNYFTIEVILAYVIKLQMIERWANLDDDKGKEIFAELISELNKSFEFSKEFKINERRSKTN